MLGEILDRKYKLVRLLGQGGMGSVYEAEHTGTRRRVAVKVISGHLAAAHASAAHRFRREARAASALESDHIVRVLDAGDDEATGRLYLVMEHLEGEDVQHVLDRLGPLPPDAALRIAAQALAGLQQAHEKQIVHRDIKPANLFLTRRPGGEVVVKLLDFGIAKIQADPIALPHTTGLTSTGNFLGSPLYMSPEQVLSSRDVDHRTDLWSLACALYCALAGRAPHGHIDAVGRLVFTICTAPPTPLRDVAPWVAPDVADVIHRALQIRPEDRWPTAAAMLDALRPHLPGGTALHEGMLARLDPATRAAAPAHAPAPQAPHASQAPQAPPAPYTPPQQHAALWSDPTVPGTGAPPLHTPPIAADHAATWSAATIPSDHPPAAISAAPPPIGAPGSTSDPVVQDRSAASANAPTGARTRPWRLRAAIAMAGAGLLLGGAAALRLAADPEPPPTSQAEPGLPVAPTAPIAPTAVLPPEAAAAVQRVELVISPPDAQVEVDGAPAVATSGKVPIAGAPGSVHRVRIHKGSGVAEAEVYVTERGAVPPKLEIAAAPLPPPGGTSLNGPPRSGPGGPTPQAKAPYPPPSAPPAPRIPATSRPRKSGD